MNTMRPSILTAVFLSLFLISGCEKEENFDASKLELVGTKWRVYTHTYDASIIPEIVHQYVDMYEYMYFKSGDSVFIYPADKYDKINSILENTYKKTCTYKYSYSNGSVTINKDGTKYIGSKRDDGISIFDKVYVSYK